MLDPLIPEAGAFYVMDRAYLNFQRLYQLHQSGAFLVTRAKSSINCQRMSSSPIDRSAGLISDQSVLLNGQYAAQDNPGTRRWARFTDPATQSCLVSLSNHFGIPALSVCAQYKKRWQVELFFKCIKQHLRIERFLGTPENTVKSQAWITATTYVLVAIVRKRPKFDLSLHTMLQILSMTTVEKITLIQIISDI